MRYNRADIESTVKAAAHAARGGRDVFIFATALGWTINSERPPFDRPYLQVHGLGATAAIIGREKDIETGTWAERDLGTVAIAS